MYIGKRPSSGRGEFEIAEALGGIAPADLIDRPIVLDCGPYGMRPTAVELRSDASQGKLRLRRIGTGGIQIHRQVLAMLLYPRSTRDESTLPGGQPVVMLRRYIVRRMDITSVDLSGANATIRLGCLEFANQSGNHEEDFGVRLGRIAALHARASELPPPLAAALSAHEALLRGPTPLVADAEQLVEEIMRWVADAADDYDRDYAFGTDVLPDLEAMLAPPQPAEPVAIDQIPDDELELRRREIGRWRRTAAARGYPAFVFRSAVQAAYRQTCVVCGLRFPRSADCPVPGVDAAHILPWSQVELDEVYNGLCLCKLHHWAFDQRLISIRCGEDGVYRVGVTDAAVRALANEPASLAALRRYEGPIDAARLPNNAAQRPRPELLERLYEAVRPDL